MGKGKGENEMILYKKRRRYKYNLHSEKVEYATGITVAEPKDLKFLAIDGEGNLVIRKGYSWDGASGPVADTKTVMKGSLIHDALYQLMREGVLPQDDAVRERADEILREVCIESGMSKAYAWLVYHGVRLGGAGAAKPDMLSAP